MNAAARRPFRAALIVGVLALLVASCGGGGDGDDTAAPDGGALPECPLEALDNATQPVEVIVWHSLQAKQKDTLDELAADYNASQGRVQVRMESIAATDEELLRRFQSALPSRKLPSISWPTTP